MASFHTEAERRLVRALGGEPRQAFGHDGELPDGRPVEVRVTRGGDKFRVDRDTHETMTRRDGLYVFDDLNDGLPPRTVPADEVTDLAGRGEPWLTDRDFPHKFVERDDVFGGGLGTGLDFI